MIENEPNEITLIFHSDKADDRKMRAFVETISTFKVKSLDLQKQSLTETQVAEIGNKMNVSINSLIDKTYLDLNSKKENNDIDSISDADMLTMIVQNPKVLHTPILIVGKKAYSYESAFEILDQHFKIDGVASIPSANKEEKQSID